MHTSKQLGCLQDFLAMLPRWTEAAPIQKVLIIYTPAQHFQIRAALGQSRGQIAKKAGQADCTVHKGDYGRKAEASLMGSGKQCMWESLPSWTHSQSVPLERQGAELYAACKI